VGVSRPKYRQTAALFQSDIGSTHRIPNSKSPKLKLPIQVANFLHSKLTNAIYPTSNHPAPNCPYIADQHASLGNNGEHCNYSKMFYFNFSTISKNILCLPVTCLEHLCIMPAGGPF
jgi:hypothetical protein